ncbi:MAG TPA: cupredoxin domain-containing protein [Blastocatellia bacterium]|nr:cupredoxin domain-containing protein [Blastocatellia bacterium]
MKRTITLITISLVLGVALNAAAQRPGRRTAKQKPVLAAAKKVTPPADEQVIRVTARKFEFSPATITVRKGVPVVIELTSLDRKHGFYLPGFGIRKEVVPGATRRVGFTPDKTGTFPFACHVFCGDGHEEMNGTLVVRE